MTIHESTLTSCADIAEALELKEITGENASKELRSVIEYAERRAKYKTRLGRRYAFENELHEEKIPFSVQAASDCIESALKSTCATTENPLRIKLCMEDARTPNQIHMLCAWCSNFKALEGKKITSVGWETDPDPKRSYIRHLVITTE